MMMNRKIHHHIVFLQFLTSLLQYLLDKEGVDLKVLVHEINQNSERGLFVGVIRKNDIRDVGSTAHLKC